MPTPWWPIATPSSSKLRGPTKGELLTWKNGPDRFPNIGDVKVYHDTYIIPGQREYNCFAWSLGFQDRWIDGGTREDMLKLYAHYYYVACTTAEAEIDVYDIPDAPKQLSRTTRPRKNHKGEIIPAATFYYPNPQAVVMHAHRNDDLATNNSSSMLSSVVKHGRQDLEDTRPWGAKNPSIRFGTIYGHFKRHPGHPSFPGKKTKLPDRPPHPQDPRNANPAAPEYPSGSAPMGHPRSSLSRPIAVLPHPPCTLNANASLGLRGGAVSVGTVERVTGLVGKLKQPGKATKPARLQPSVPTKVPAPGTAPAPASASTTLPRRPPTSDGHGRPSSRGAPTTLPNAPNSNSSRAASSSTSSSTSSKGYKKLPLMDPWAPIPPPSSAAVASAKDMYAKLATTSPDLVNSFNTKYDAWKKTWFKDDSSPNSATRAEGPEFNALVALGPKIVPLTVYRLTSGQDFMAVVLYDKLETDLAYKVDPKDISNYKVLQRRTNLISTASIIIDMSLQRNVEVESALKAWAELRERRSVHGNSKMFTDGEGYWALADMGPSIISHVMLEYYNDQSGWYHELLHELVHGKVSGAGIFFKPILFANWKDWFEHKDHKDAPEGPDARARMGHGYTMDDIPSST